MSLCSQDSTLHLLAANQRQAEEPRGLIPKSHQCGSPCPKIPSVPKPSGKQSWPRAHSQPQLLFPGKSSPTGSPTISCFCGKFITTSSRPCSWECCRRCPRRALGWMPAVPQLPAWQIPASARSSCHGTGNAAAQGTSARGHPFPWHTSGWHSPCHRAPRAAGSALGHTRTHIPRSTNIPSRAVTVAAIWQHQVVPRSCCPHPKGTWGAPHGVPTSLGLWGLSPGQAGPAFPSHLILSSHAIPSPCAREEAALIALGDSGGFAFFTFFSI